MSAQCNNLSATQFMDEVAGRFALRSTGGASESGFAPLVRLDTNAISSGSSPATAAEPVETADDPTIAPAPSSSWSLPLMRLHNGRRSSILVGLLLSAAFMRFSLHPFSLRASSATRRSLRIVKLDGSFTFGSQVSSFEVYPYQRMRYCTPFGVSLCVITWPMLYSCFGVCPWGWLVIGGCSLCKSIS